MAEVVGRVNGKPLQAKTSTREMYAAIDALVDRVDAQFRKWKGRLVATCLEEPEDLKCEPMSSCYSTTVGEVFKFGDARKGIGR